MDADSHTAALACLAVLDDYRARIDEAWDGWSQAFSGGRQQSDPDETHPSLRHKRAVHLLVQLALNEVNLLREALEAGDVVAGGPVRCHENTLDSHPLPMRWVLVELWLRIKAIPCRTEIASQEDSGCASKYEESLIIHLSLHDITMRLCDLLSQADAENQFAELL